MAEITGGKWINQFTPAKDDTGDFMRGINQSFNELGGTAYGLAGLAGGLMDAEGLKQWGLENARRKFDKAESYGRPGDQVENIDSVGGAVDWLQHGLGYVAGQALPSVLTGGLGAFVAKRAAQVGIKAAAAEAVELGAAPKQVAATIELMTQNAARRGAMVGAGAASYGQEAGSMYPEMVQEGHDEPWRAAAFAVPAAAMDVLPELRAIQKLYPGAGQAMTGGMLRRMGKEGLKQAGLEAGTEGIQTAIERAAAYKSLNNGEAFSDYLNSMALGALGGGVMGGIQGALNREGPKVGTTDPVDLLGGRYMEPNMGPEFVQRPPALEGEVVNHTVGVLPNMHSGQPLLANPYTRWQWGDNNSPGAQPPMLALPDRSQTMAVTPDGQAIQNDAQRDAYDAMQQYTAQQQARAAAQREQDELDARYPALIPSRDQILNTLGTRAVGARAFAAKLSQIQTLGPEQALVALDALTDTAHGAAWVRKDMTAKIDSLLATARRAVTTHAYDPFAYDNEGRRWRKDQVQPDMFGGQDTTVTGPASPFTAHTVIQDQPSFVDQLLAQLEVSKTLPAAEREAWNKRKSKPAQQRLLEAQQAKAEAVGEGFGTSDNPQQQELAYVLPAYKGQEIAQGVANILGQAESYGIDVRGVLKNVPIPERMTGQEVAGYVRNVANALRASLPPKSPRTQNIMSAMEALANDAETMPKRPETGTIMADDGTSNGLTEVPTVKPTRPRKAKATQAAPEVAAEPVGKPSSVEPQSSEPSTQTQPNEKEKGSNGTQTVEAKQTETQKSQEPDTTGGVNGNASQSVRTDRRSEAPQGKTVPSGKAEVGASTKGASSAGVEAAQTGKVKTVGDTTYDTKDPGKPYFWLKKLTRFKSDDAVDLGHAITEFYTASGKAYDNVVRVIYDTATASDVRKELRTVAQEFLAHPANGVMPEDIAAAKKFMEGNTKARAELDNEQQRRHAYQNQMADENAAEAEDKILSLAESKGKREPVAETPADERDDAVHFLERDENGSAPLAKTTKDKPDAKNASLVAELEAAARKKDPSAKFRAVSVSSNYFTRGIEALAALFGKRVVWVDSGGKFDGAIHRATDQNVIFVDPSSRRGAFVLIGHEIGHHLAAESPRAFADFVKYLHTSGVINQNAWDQLASVTPKDENGNINYAEVSEEAIGNILGHMLQSNGARRDFFKALAGQPVTVVDRVLGALQQAVFKVMEAIRGARMQDRGHGRLIAALEDVKSEAEKLLRAHRVEGGVNAKAQYMRKDGFSPVDTTSAAFKKWFGGSKVVDKDGKPMRMYHGSAVDINEFKSRAQMRRESTDETTRHLVYDNEGIYFTADPEYANAYTPGWGLGDSANITPVYLSIQNPYVIKGVDERLWTRIKDYFRGRTAEDRFKEWNNIISGEKGRSASVSPKQLAEFRAQGYDGIINPYLDEVVVFSPTQIKSAVSNTGEFSSTNPDIRYMRKEAELTRPSKLESFAEKHPALGDVFGKFYDLVHQHGAGLVRGGKFFSQLDQQYSKLFSYGNGKSHLTDLWDTIKARGADAETWLHKAGMATDTINAYVRTNKENATKLFTLMTDATLNEMSPALPFEDKAHDHLRSKTDPAFTAKNRALHAELRGRYNALGEQGKKAYNEARDYSAATWNERKTRVMSLIERTYSNLLKDAGMSSEQLAEAQKWHNAKRNVREVDGKYTPEYEAWRSSLTPRQKKLMREWNESGTDFGNKFAEINGDYFPLLRFGEYMVTKKSAAYKAMEAKIDALRAAYTELRDADVNPDPKSDEYKAHIEQVTKARKAVKEAEQQLGGMKSVEANYVHERYESKYAAMKAAEKLFPDLSPAEAHKMVNMAAADVHETAGVNTLFMKRLEQALSAEFDPADANRIKTLMNQMWLEMLPDKSAMKSQLKRMKVSGAHEDMRRSFAANSVRSAYHLAGLKYNDQMTDSMMHMREFDGVEAREIYKEAVRRHIAGMNMAQADKVSNIERGLTSAAFIYMLGSSPAFLMTNAMQSFMISGPMLGARFGTGKANAALGKAIGEVSKALYSVPFKAKEIDPNALSKAADEQRMLQKLMQNKLLDFTIGNEVRDVAEGERNATFWIKHGISVLPQRVEVMNRAGTALAAYRLAESQGMNEEAATKYAMKVVEDTHFNYSHENAPYWMKPGVLPGSRVLLQFRKYQLGMVHLLANQIAGAFKDTKGLTGKELEAAQAEKRYAGRALLGLVTMNTIMAGALGFPGMNVAMFAAQIIGSALSSPDEPWDAEAEFRKFLASVFGKEGGAIVAKGAPMLAGIDASIKMGMGGVFSALPFLDTKPGKKATETYTEMLTQLMGPAVGGLGMRFARGVDYAAHGDLMKASEQFLPKMIADGIKGYRVANEGLTTASGHTVMTPDQISLGDAIFQSMGYTPAFISEHYDAQGSVKAAQDFLKSRVHDIKRGWVQAKEAGDAQGMREYEQQLDAYNEARRADGEPVVPRSELIKAARAEQKYRANLNEQGISLSKKQKAMGEHGSWAWTK